MNNQILDTNQQKLLPIIKSLSSDFYLVGGTAIALYIGHRRSIDFDLFTKNTFDPIKLRTEILKAHQIEHTYNQGEGDLTVLINNVKITFFNYPFNIEVNEILDDIIKLPDLMTLGAMKAFALGKRAKWKDYVDLFFILQKHSFNNLIEKTKLIFKNEFNEKLFRSQLSYFEDIDYSEEIDYMSGFEQKDETIKTFLEKISLT